MLIVGDWGSGFRDQCCRLNNPWASCSHMYIANRSGSHSQNSCSGGKSSSNIVSHCDNKTSKSTAPIHGIIVHLPLSPLSTADHSRRQQKTSWADDVDEQEHKIEESVDENGVRTTVEWSVNDEGKKVKVCFHPLFVPRTPTDQHYSTQITRRIKRTLQKSVVEHAVAERQKWAKFGAEKGNKPGPDRATTTVGETVTLKLSAGNKVCLPSMISWLVDVYTICPFFSSSTLKQNKPLKITSKPVFRKHLVLGKSHVGFVKVIISPQSVLIKIPWEGWRAVVSFFKPALIRYPVTNRPLADTGAGPDDDTPAIDPSSSLPPSTSTTGKYVPPSMRSGSRSTPGESMRGAPGSTRDDLPTLRVTNISEDTQENDLRELFGIFGRVARVYVGRDRDTGAGKGFAFVSFEERAVAQKAMEKVNGKGYDNLILSVQWSRECF